MTLPTRLLGWRKTHLAAAVIACLILSRPELQVKLSSISINLPVFFKTNHLVNIFKFHLDKEIQKIFDFFFKWLNILLHERLMVVALLQINAVFSQSIK